MGAAGAAVAGASAAGLAPLLGVAPCRPPAGRHADPSAAIMDSQSVNTTEESGCIIDLHLYQFTGSAHRYQDWRAFV
jgi:hypothetical protein